MALLVIYGETHIVHLNVMVRADSPDRVRRREAEGGRVVKVSQSIKIQQWRGDCCGVAESGTHRWLHGCVAGKTLGFGDGTALRSNLPVDRERHSRHSRCLGNVPHRRRSIKCHGFRKFWVRRGRSAGETELGRRPREGACQTDYRQNCLGGGKDSFVFHSYFSSMTGGSFLCRVLLLLYL